MSKTGVNCHYGEQCGWCAEYNLSLCSVEPEELSRKQVKLNRYVTKKGLRFEVRNSERCLRCHFRFQASCKYCPKCGLVVDKDELDPWTKASDYPYFDDSFEKYYKEFNQYTEWEE